jgi:hypothetical protein
MTDHPLDGARKRIERADKHLKDFVAAVEAYAASEAKNITIEYDEVRNQPNVILAPKSPRPIELALIVSDCIHNLRAALDYLVYELSREDSGDADPSGTQFPITIEDDRTKESIGRKPFATFPIQTSIGNSLDREAVAVPISRTDAEKYSEA